MQVSEDEILDLPERKTQNREEFKWVRVLALLFFILALTLKFIDAPGHLLSILAGSFFFILWAILRFVKLPKKELSEYFYLPARLLLVSGLSIRYIWHWKFDYLLVYTGLAFFVVGWILTLRAKR